MHIPLMFSLAEQLHIGVDLLVVCLVTFSRLATVLFKISHFHLSYSGGFNDAISQLQGRLGID